MCALLLALGALTWPGLAYAAQTTPTTFGADLTARAPLSTVSCDSLYFQPTCTLSTSADQLGGTGESFIVPQGPDDHGTGTITAFHVAMGNYTGPVQILLLQALRQSANSAGCCSVVDATPWFTPAANSITTVPVNWTTENDNIPNPYDNVFAFDVMAISVSSGVSLPVSPQTNAVDTFWAPACPGTAGTECDVYGGDERYVVTMSADWTPNPGSNTTPVPPNPNPVRPHEVPSLLPGTSSGVVKSGRVTIPLTCATAACVGSVQLQNFKANNATIAGGKRRHATYGKAAFDIAAGKRHKVTIKLDRAGRELLAHHRRVRVWLNFTLRTGQRFSRSFVLRR